MMNLNRYLYYRFFYFFSARGNGIAETAATSLLTLLQFLTVLCIIILLNELNLLIMPGKFYFGIGIILLMLLNYFVFERNIDVTRMKQKGESESVKTRCIKGWIIVLYFLLVTGIPIGLGVIRHNLN